MTWHGKVSRPVLMDTMCIPVVTKCRELLPYLGCNGGPVLNTCDLPTNAGNGPQAQVGLGVPLWQGICDNFTVAIPPGTVQAEGM